MPKAAADIRGLEYDWLGIDEDRCVALFTTAGGGYAPLTFLEDTDAHLTAIRTVLSLPESTTAMFAPSLGANYVNTWRLMAERGLYAYDADADGGPYRLVAMPSTPMRVEDLPPSVVTVASRFSCRFRFAAEAVVTDALLAPQR